MIDSDDEMSVFWTEGVEGVEGNNNVIKGGMAQHFQTYLIKQEFLRRKGLYVKQMPHYKCRSYVL